MLCKIRKSSEITLSHNDEAPICSIQAERGLATAKDLPLMCLNCRKSGHLVESGMNETTGGEVDWFLSKTPEAMRVPEISGS